MEVKKRLAAFAGWKYAALCLLVVATLVLHLVVISNPRELILDEQHYVADARSIIKDHITLRTEHPPLGKLFIVAGILIFGDNPVGWRFFSILMGTISIILFYFICLELGMSRRATLLATFLLAFENLSFVQASVAMLDVFMVTLMLASFLFYLKGEYPLSALALALSALSKLTGALGAGVIGVHWLIVNRTKVISFMSQMLLAPVFFFGLMPVFDYIVTRQWQSPAQRIKTMMSLMASLTFANTQHESMSRPWQWVLLPKLMAYWYNPHYTAAISFTVWGLIIPVVVYLGLRAVRNNAGVFGLGWFASTYLIWIPANLLTDRVTFIFYFYPVIGSVCLGVGLGLSQIYVKWGRLADGKSKWISRVAIWGYLVAHIIVFIVLSPISG